MWWLDSISSYISNTDSSTDIAAVVEHEDVVSRMPEGSSSACLSPVLYRERGRDREERTGLALHKGLELRSCIPTF